MTKNPVSWWEIASSDADSTAKFFERVFDWNLKYDEKTKIYELPAEGDTSNGFHGGGIFTLKNPDIPPHLTIYVTVDDVDATAERVIENGGKIVLPPFDEPGIGRLCLFTEPNGQIIAMINRSKK